jgi:hypothetical protein
MERNGTTSPSTLLPATQMHALTSKQTVTVVIFNKTVLFIGTGKSFHLSQYGKTNTKLNKNFLSTS